VAMMRPIAL